MRLHVSLTLALSVCLPLRVAWAAIDSYPVVLMNACSSSPHTFVGDDGSLLVRRFVDNDVGVQQFCETHADILSPLACTRIRTEVFTRRQVFTTA